jgi:hypothetical protein
MIRVRKMQPVDVTKLNFEKPGRRVNVAGDFYAVEGAFPQSSAKSADFKSILDFGDSVPDCLPENNGTTYQEALDVIDKALCALCGRGLADVYIKQTRVVSRYYKYKVVDGERVWLDPVNDRGFYQFDGRQLFHGIPDEYCGNYTTDGKAPAFGDIGVSVADGDTWGFHLGWLNETGVLYDDVPILSFEKAKAAYEELIEKGLVRDVLEARLCYTSYIDPDDSDVFYLLPYGTPAAFTPRRRIRSSRPLRTPTRARSTRITLNMRSWSLRRRRGRSWTGRQPAGQAGRAGDRHMDQVE